MAFPRAALATAALVLSPDTSRLYVANTTSRVPGRDAPAPGPEPERSAEQRASDLRRTGRGMPVRAERP